MARRAGSGVQGRIARLADPGGAEFFVIKYRPAV
jgi:hypothetical protein